MVSTADEATPRQRAHVRPETGEDGGYANLPDGALMRLVKQRDGAALEALYARYGRPCHSLARRILLTELAAQDVVQEIFLALWRDPARYDETKASFGSWLMAATHHKSVDAVRREESLRRRTGPALTADEQGPRATVSDDPADEAWERLRRDRVREVIGTLPEAQREALLLAYYGGFTQREIAALTKTPLGTVKTRMLTGMRRMRDALQTSVIDLPGLTPADRAGGAA